MSALPSVDLADLAGLRSAPTLEPDQRQQLLVQLQERLRACSWFTIGVMAPSADAAVAALRATEQALGWTPLRPDPAGTDAEQVEGPVFLKGNQHSGHFLLRAETGLGEGILITGHQPQDPSVQDTWGPLPLDLFAA